MRVGALKSAIVHGRRIREACPNGPTLGHGASIVRLRVIRSDWAFVRCRLFRWNRDQNLSHLAKSRRRRIFPESPQNHLGPPLTLTLVATGLCKDWS
jgi:hypothetical protein